LDVIYIEKNIFDNIFNTNMDVKGKKKDNMKSRIDLTLYCDHKSIEVNVEFRVVKPKATFILDKVA